MQGRLVERADGCCVVQVGGRHYRASTSGDGLDGAVGYAVRPEKITLRPTESTDSPNRISGKVSNVAYHGDITHFHIDVGFERPFLAHVVNRSESYSPLIGVDVVLEWRAEDAVVLSEGAA
jgi:spermidine/putrescine transport system ATP-binding protein/putrescine transport system ATP-binding protein